MIDDNINRLLMSEDLIGVIPDLESEQVREFENSFIVAVFEILFSENEKEVLAGSLVGCSIEQDLAKVDFKVNLSNAYSLVEKYSKGQILCNALHLCLGEKETVFNGPYQVSSLKIVDIERQDRTCVLGLDLFKS